MLERRSSRTHQVPILIAEDNDLQRTLLEYTLRKAGHEVTAAADGRQALELFASGYYPIVITDWLMPHLDGLELCRSIRENCQDTFTYVILHSSLDDSQDIQKALQAGIDTYLIKPATPADLELRLATARRVLKLEQTLRRKLEEARQLAATDALTNLYTRGFLDQRLPMEVKRAIRYDRPLSIIFADIDHFKTINDTYGHRAGDEVLQGVASLMKGKVREEVDWLARYGGEEFVVILPETAIDGAMTVADRLQRAVAETPIAVDGREISITASFGAASFAPGSRLDAGAMVRDLLGMADSCLYAAKRGGRNRCEGACLH